jgi:hypothetical protein
MSLSCFVVRPFGLRSYQASAGRTCQVDYQRVHDELIAPAMRLAGLEGNTTEDIAQAGNIREDMFALLAHADVVIADISLHNANVFYELGARHALRQRRTFLIRFAADEVPFDLRTDRYLAYDPDAPGASVQKLAQGLRDTIADARKVDSPIFNMLPALNPPAVADLIPVPQVFKDEVGQAQARGGLGHLLLLSEESELVPWGTEGMRLVGRALYQLEAWAHARALWERLGVRCDGDLEADTLLGTICQRLDDLPASDQAIERVLARKDLTTRDRAEAYALAGRNAKQRWRNTWSALPKDQPNVAAGKALHSPFLKTAQNRYALGFAADLNHYYSGINALDLLRIRIELAEVQPGEWINGFDDEDAAAAELKRLKTELGDLVGAVQWSVQREIDAHPVGSDAARWALCTRADLLLLRKAPPARVATAFVEALEGAQPVYFGSVRTQLDLYRSLGLFPEQLVALDQALPGLQAASARSPRSAPGRVLVFSGHRIDAPQRAKPRFPPAAENLAAAAIEQAVIAACGDFAPDQVLGIAGGASGGDLLFHEACFRRGIATALKLAIPERDYIVESVAVAGQPGWIERFHAVRQRCDEHGAVAQLSATPSLPPWLARVRDYKLWERNNRWTLLSALAYGADKVRLIVLWDGEPGKPGDAPGGTEHMVRTARAAGAEVLHLDTRKIFREALAGKE